MEIKQWDPKDLVDFATVIIYAKRRSGKSVAVQDILYHNKQRYDEIYLFSNTIELQGDDVYSFVPKGHKYNDLENEVIQGIMDKQTKEIEKEKKQKSLGRKYKVPHICIVLDDILSSKTFLKRSNNIITTLFVNGRHYHITLFVLSQSFSGLEGIPPIYRKNSDHIMAFFLHNQYDRENMAKQYLSVENHQAGQKLLQEITEEPFQMIIIDNHKAGARSYDEYVFKYKADIKIRKFMIGKEQRGMFKDMDPDKLRIPT